MHAITDTLTKTALRLIRTVDEINRVRREMRDAIVAGAVAHSQLQAWEAALRDAFEVVAP